jgi:CheY-like chemotaxis protein
MSNLARILAQPISAETDATSRRVPTVLVIDDDPQIGRLLKAGLARHGVEVLNAGDMVEGYWMAINHCPDAIITDYDMPQGSGESLLLRLKSGPQTRDIPVIVLTGWLLDGRRDLALERQLLGLRGASGFLPKPVELPTVVRELRKHLPAPVAAQIATGEAERRPAATVTDLSSRLASVRRSLRAQA